ncbi:VOC family protein [Methylobacterium brachythecii]|uniref:Putative glyoxalase superfamily protein PhnB n=1 Tax=Methylobacterium brachythecii TaxID=1176177 RepID=A0A7W6AFA5_9HYPH|nr:VOC family protein [Methylobacterium brachythecii]MBB3902245.1 putative glyoxalase superfamily protein PhnB [Methylobacterium brachythecii]GLS42091.1 hypothetical protein GCM10007884_00760 [Methylobacterium brachythecii]
MGTEIIPYLFYRDVPAALDWLRRVFGFQEESRHPTSGGGMHASMLLDGQRIMMGQGSDAWRMVAPSDETKATAGIFVYVPDVRAHHARAEAAGAEISQPLADHGYGLTYTVWDLDQHPWYFTQASD